MTVIHMNCHPHVEGIAMDVHKPVKNVPSSIEKEVLPHSGAHTPPLQKEETLPSPAVETLHMPPARLPCQIIGIF